MILVTGASGHVGRELVQALLALGEPVRGVTRAESGATLPPGAEQVTGDLNRPETLVPALEGVRGVFLLSGYQNFPQLLHEIDKSGVEQVVLLSSSAAPSDDLSNAVARYHILSEQAVRESGLPWTFLQPNSFMTNASQWAPQLRAGDVVTAPFAHARIASIDPRDVAAVAAQAFMERGHSGRSYRLSGPQSHTPEERVRVLGSVLGRNLRFEPQSNEDARTEMSGQMPAEYVDAFFRFFVEGTLDESEVLPAVKELIGRPARTFEEWARENADAFR
jgi:uncharacterized protein YbjT (DUF2867 family)